MLDRYIIGKVNRVSPEAPIPVVNAQEDRDVLGGAANVVSNVSDFGAKAQLISVIGSESAETKAMKSSLERHDCDTRGLVEDESRPTTTKTLPGLIVRCLLQFPGMLKEKLLSG